MMPPTIRQRFTLHARLRQYRWRVQQARDAITDWLSRCSNPYVSFSGGKDSSVVLHLVRSLAPYTPCVYWDADCCFPEVSALIDATTNCTRYPTDEPFLDTLARYGLFSDGDIDRATMQSTVYGPVERWTRDGAFDGAAYGLRQDESRGRRMMGRQRGAVFFSERYQVWQCQPVTTWSYDDIWAYIVTNDVPYAGTYDRMWDMPEREQRVSYWAGETNRTHGRWVWLKRNYPDLWNRLCTIIPEARSFT